VSSPPIATTYSRPQRLDILQHRWRHIEYRTGYAALGGLLARKLLSRKDGWQLFHLGRIGPRTVEIRSTRSINGAGVLAIEWLDIPRFACRIFQIHVRQSFPAAADANNVVSNFGAPVDNRLDDRI
jgi:hypothetical protein